MELYEINENAYGIYQNKYQNRLSHFEFIDLLFFLRNEIPNYLDKFLYGNEIGDQGFQAGYVFLCSRELLEAKISEFLKEIDNVA